MSDQIFDAEGLPITGSRASDAFSSIEMFDSVDEILKQAAIAINHLATMDGAELFKSALTRPEKTRKGDERHVCDQLENLRRWIRHLRPHVAGCPRCYNESKYCKVCMGLPYITKRTWDYLPSDTRDRFIKTRRSGK